MEIEKSPSRRNFLKAAAAGSAWALVPGCGHGENDQPAQSPAAEPLGSPGLKINPPPLKTVRVGLVGAGERGAYLLQILLGIEDVHVNAVCDLVESKVARAQQLVVDRRRPKPEGYAGPKADFRQLCQRDDVDLVINATPWQLHAQVCLAALAAGKHVATEPPVATTVEQCWQEIEAAAKANRHCTLLENYCYQREVMLVWNMVRQGLFGEIMHLEGGYQKDGRDSELRTAADGSPGWRGQFRKDRKGNVFPTHDVGPLSQWLDINRGDRFEYLVSMGGNARALNEYGAKHLGPDSYLATTHFDMSDINVSLLRTVKGRTVYLISDTLLSRPQPRNVYRLLGSKGIYDRTLDKIYLEGRSPQRDRWGGDWEPLAKYYNEFDHPLWRDLRSRALGSGTGGSDYLCLYRLIHSLRGGTPPDIDVYDAATWSSIVELSEKSAQGRSQAVDFPDFTRGQWKTMPPRSWEREQSGG